MLRTQILTKTSEVFRDNHTCGFCHNHFLPEEEVVTCPQCGAVHHASCWQANGNKCTTHLCSGVGMIASSSSPPHPRIPRDTLVAALIGGLITIVLVAVVGFGIVFPRINMLASKSPAIIAEPQTATTIVISNDGAFSLGQTPEAKQQVSTDVSTLLPTLVSTPLPTSTRPPTPEPPTSTPKPTSTTKPPTSTPNPTPCGINPGQTLRSSWDQRQLQYSLGCPLTHEHGVVTAYQSFEKGFMIWRQDTERIYVILSDGTWEIHNDTWSEGQPEYICPETASSNTPPTPRRGFGEVWCTEPGLRDRIGNATSDEIGNPRSLQDFQNGVMFAIPEAGVYLLFESSYQWTN